MDREDPGADLRVRRDLEVTGVVNDVWSDPAVLLNVSTVSRLHNYHYQVKTCMEERART